jgi:hypothetical protein
MRIIFCINQSENIDINIGRVYLHLNSIELYVRLFLLITRVGSKKAIEFNQSLDKLKKGQTVEENEITNFEQLSTLIEKYNDKVKEIHKELIIDKNLVELRHALAHGRAFTIDPSTPSKNPMTLLKFANPTDHKTTVDFCDLMTNQWFDEQVKRTKKEKFKVIEACRLASIKNP